MTIDRAHLEPSSKHPITIGPSDKHVVVKAGEVTVADTRSALSLAESDYPPVLYVPLANVDTSQLERTEHTTYCPYKGDASYYSLLALGPLGKNAVWEYADPYPAVAQIKGTVAFYSDRAEIIED